MSSYSHKLLAFAPHALLMLWACIHASEATFFPPPCPPPPPPPSPTTSTFYLQVVFANGTNNAIANAFGVAGIQGKPYSLLQFGTVYVFDANITTTPSPTSALVGQAFGTLIATSLNAPLYQVSLTNYFTSGSLAGSTLVILGISNGTEQVRPIPIVGGTNALTYATGYVSYQTISVQGPAIVVQVTANYIIA